MAKSQVFYKVVKAKRGHPFSGLYAVIKYIVRGHQVVEKEIVKEWDLRILAEAAIARYGGSDAFDEYIADNGEPDGLEDIPMTESVKPRDLSGLTKNKLARELKLKSE